MVWSLHQEKVKDLENQALSNETHKLELNKLKLMLEVKESELHQLQKSNLIHIDQMEHLRKAVKFITGLFHNGV